MTRPAPPFLRTNSSPAVPTSFSSTIPARRDAPLNIAEPLLHALPLPHLVFDSFLRLHTLNDAARSVFGITSGHGGPGQGGGDFPLGGADIFLCVTSDMQARGGAGTGATSSATTFDKIRDELESLADKQEERARSAGFGSADGAWGEGDKMELKSGKVPGLRWSAEVMVTRFFPPRQDAVSDTLAEAALEQDDEEMPSWLGHGSSRRRSTIVPSLPGAAWFSVLVLRPWREAAQVPYSSHDRLLSHRRSFSLDTPLVVSSISPFSSGYTPTAPTFSTIPPSPTLPATAARAGPSSPSRSPATTIHRKDLYSLADRTPTLGSSSTTVNPFGLSAIAQRRGSATILSSAHPTPQPGHAASWEFAQPFGATTEDGELETVEPEEEVQPVAGEGRRRSISGVPPDPAEWPSVAPPLGSLPAKSGLRLPHVALAAANAISPGAAQQRGGAGSGGSSGSGSAGSAGSLLSIRSSTTAKTSPSRDSHTSTSASVAHLPEALKGMGISVSSAGIHLTQSSPLVMPTSEPSAPSTPAVSTFPAAAFTSPGTPRGGLTPTAQNPMPLHLPMPRPRPPHPLSMSRSSPSDSSSGSTGSSPSHFPLPSPRPTALPPIPDAPPRYTPDAPALLKFAAIANLPNTGVILADAELTSGYVNALARELLMGVPSTDGLAESSDSEWWQQGQWFADDEPWSSASGTTHASSTSQTFFSPSADARANPLDARDLTYQAIIASGEAINVDVGKGTAGSSLRIGRASETNRYRATVAGILARSLVTDERRKAALGKGGPPSSGSHVGPDVSGLRGFSAFGARRSPGGASSGSSGSGSNSSTQIPQFVAAGGIAGHNRKPYKIYDESFSQRIIDPFEPLLEMAARKGELPPQLDPDADVEEEILAGQVANGMIVGVEVEVWDTPAPGVGAPSSAAPVNPLKQDSFMTSASPQLLGQRKRRVRRRIIEVSSTPIFAPGPDGKKQHLGGVLVLRDVTTERKRWTATEGRTPRKKSAAEGYYKQILDAIPQLIWRTTPMGSHNYFNASWYEYTGLEPEQSLGLGWQSPFHEDDMPVCLKAWSHSLATGEPYAVEYRCRRHDGVWRWMLGRARPYRDADGKIQGWFGTCTDFHELYNMREQLRGTLQQNAAVVQGAGCLLLAVDAQQRISFMEGTHKDQMLQNANVIGPIEGQDLLVLKPEPEFYAAYKGVISGELAQGTTEWTSTQGRSFRCLLTPLTETRNGTTSIVGCIIVAHDITDLVQTQARLQQAYEERAELQASETAATEASRLKSEFLAHMSHELRTPIAQLLGLGELLLAEQLNDSQRTLASQILRSGDVLLEMIGQVLDMGKVEAGKLDIENRPFDLNDLTADAQLFSTAARKKGLQFIDDVDEFGSPVVGDMPRLRQVLNNLLANAIKFTRVGSIKLGVKRLAEDQESVTVRWTVEDTGVGIRKEAISTLFKPFHQADVSTSRLFGGAGLGLSISKNLIELMGGSIGLESEYGVGSIMTVELKLPKVPSELVEQDAPVMPSVVETFRKESIWLLVVDDNELNRIIISKLLTKMGFNVESVSNGYDALDAIARKDYSLVILDNQMDGIDGLETMIRMRRSPIPRVANVKVIALTASALKGDQEKFLANGADGYLSKPVRSNVLESTILRVLQPATDMLGRRRSSASNPSVGSPSPSVESASRSGFNFGSFRPGAPPEHVDFVAPPRRRPSHPSYGEGSL